MGLTDTCNARSARTSLFIFPSNCYEKITATDKKSPNQPETVEKNLTKSKPAPPPAEAQRPKELSPIERYRFLGHF